MEPLMLLIIIGGLLEPVWVISLKKFNSDRSFKWGAMTAVFVVLSPVLLGLGMIEVPMGIAYAIWTGIGAVCTLIIGRYLYNDAITALRLVCMGLILAGVIGLQLVTGGV